MLHATNERLYFMLISCTKTQSGQQPKPLKSEPITAESKRLK